MGEYSNKNNQLGRSMENELYEESYKNPQHFSFGKNWKNFLKSLNERRVKEAEESLIDFLGGKENIAGKTFVDIGCGSGLFSLAAYRLGARKIVSVDIDDSSVACAKYLHEKNNKPEQWEIKTGSALNPEFLHSLGVFDIVYSWGVLHHTGSMYPALENVTSLVAPEGKIFIALYNDNQRFMEGTSSFWLKAKQIYNKSSSFEKHIIEALYTTYYIIGLTLNLVNPITYIKNYHSLRGMSFMTDIKDWLGGYPYEYAYSEKIIAYFKERGFECAKTNPARSIGCNEFLFIKK
jgi:2-polyprenyl-6-hydroxyphenyl methylase/3-demethylubiquinone-9 3-methyltransferase